MHVLCSHVCSLNRSFLMVLQTLVEEVGIVRYVFVVAVRAGQRAAFGIESLPRTLEEALEELRRDPLILDVLGEHVAAHYIAGKQREWEEYQTRVSSWELERYLVAY